MTHTVNLAISINAVVFDDRGRLVEAYLFPLALLFFHLLGYFYTWLQSLSHRAGQTAEWLHSYIAGWEDDLRLMGLAIRLLFYPGGNLATR